VQRANVERRTVDCRPMLCACPKIQRIEPAGRCGDQTGDPDKIRCLTDRVDPQRGTPSSPGKRLSSLISVSPPGLRLMPGAASARWIGQKAERLRPEAVFCRAVGSLRCSFLSPYYPQPGS